MLLCLGGGGGVPHPRVGGYPSQVLMMGGTLSQVWGYPIPGWGVPQPGLDGGGTPGTPTIQIWLGSPQMGYPHHPDLAGVPPTPDLGMGTPHHPDLDGVPPRPEMGYPPTIKTWMGYPPPSRPGWVTPHPWDGVPHHPDLDGVPPDLRWGTPHHSDLDGVPPHPKY